METKEKKAPTTEKGWELKERTYILKGMSPLTYRLQSKSTRRKPLLWFAL